MCNFLRRNISPYSTPFPLLLSSEASSRGFALTISKLQCCQLFVFNKMARNTILQECFHKAETIRPKNWENNNSWQHCQIPLYYVVIASKWRQCWRLLLYFLTYRTKQMYSSCFCICKSLCFIVDVCVIANNVSLAPFLDIISQKVTSRCNIIPPPQCTPL